jgi:hypothetical protein
MNGWRTTLLALVALPLLMQAGAALAIERVARCVITSRGEPAWRGPCNFTSGRGGSFALSGVDGRSLDGMSDFALEVTSPGVGRASYMMVSGRHEDGGVLRRSRRDRACWVGRNYSICIY